MSHKAPPELHQHRHSGRIELGHPDHIQGQYSRLSLFYITKQAVAEPRNGREIHRTFEDNRDHAIPDQWLPGQYWSCHACLPLLSWRFKTAGFAQQRKGIGTQSSFRNKPPSSRSTAETRLSPAKTTELIPAIWIDR